MWLFANPGYKSLLATIKHRIQQAQVKAVLAVNQELLLLYWAIGKQILEVQEKADWWDKVVAQLAKDLKNEFPWMSWFSRTNLMNMRRFAMNYPTEEFVQLPVGQIPRSHNILLLEKISDSEKRKRYAYKTIEYWWSKNTMVHQIESNLFEREWKAITNFTTTLTKPNSDLANSLLKDPYNFDFLMLSGKVKEKEVEDALIEKITHFLLELGSGFAYMGRQYKLAVGQEEFFLDLLFYHVTLNCYVVIELKTGKFKPEYAGKLWFYQAAIDNEIKTESQNPTIGLLLCKRKDQITAQYALDNLKRPMGISEYTIGPNLPKKLQNQLPSIKEIEEELK